MNRPLFFRFIFSRLPNLPKLVAGLVMMLLAVTGVRAAPSADLWPRWNSSNEENGALIDHQIWQTLLERYVKVTGSKEAGDPLVTRFDYKSVSAEDKLALQRYLDLLQSTPILQYRKAEQQAYWINLYNALTVNLILQRYPIDSIRKIKFGFFSFGPWDEKIATVEGESLSLNDIEHRILRPIWQDNRIHYAVNCASIGCPNLAPEVYTASNTDRLLEEGAINYVNHPRGVAVDGKTLRLSSIYDWYRVDFGDSEQGVIQHLIRYAKPELAARLSSHKFDVDYDYDWGLNSL